MVTQSYQGDGQLTPVNSIAAAKDILQRSSVPIFNEQIARKVGDESLGGTGGPGAFYALRGAGKANGPILKRSN